MTKRVLTAADILPMEDYTRNRTEHRRRVSLKKRNRRVAVGPSITFYFECFETMWLQVQEMVYIEKGGAEQVPGELEAYNPLIPNGSELTATFMIEIDDPIRRKRTLASLGGIEDAAFLRVGGETIGGIAEADQDRTTAEGKASSVQFVHFPFTPEQIAAFSTPNAEVVLGFSHPHYRHMTVLPEAVRAELATDFG
ncbi:DUF3501 family protein [Rhodopila sp.]|uniref:DUF3501 family protein n=1 Tax=Rhodopila sp. TaxID=2480087 RepID=UPI002B7C09A8|nr:DUF3501 family protein [Rhodopila sp.]HVZ10275.1 DUF3501 family protein [Rhodopila sp.]